MPNLSLMMITWCHCRRPATGQDCRWQLNQCLLQEDGCFDDLLIEFADYSAVLDGLENELLHGYTSPAGITDLVSINTYLTFHPFPQRGL